MGWGLKALFLGVLGGETRNLSLRAVEPKPSVESLEVALPQPSYDPPE
ncbi:MAG: hypothetical protein MOGMAGMI_00001 [Candidatus Omnitrophica bacterium]|nr:hypothetical protein [Candidatus Omnitrophota bacterium]